MTGRLLVAAGVVALVVVAAASPVPQDDVLVVSAAEGGPEPAAQGGAQTGALQDQQEAGPEGSLAATVVIRPPKVEKVTHVTGPNQYQKLYAKNGQYKFGFDDENQFRVEERLDDGMLRGIYGYKNEDGSITAFMYTYDGNEYKQVPYTVEDIPDDLRIVRDPSGTSRFV